MNTPVASASVPVKLERPLRIKYLVVEVPVNQTGIIDVQQLKLPDNVVRVVGVCTTNAVTDQDLRTNLRYSGTAAASMTVNEANIEALTKAVLDASFNYLDVPAPTTARPIYVAFPTRLGVPTFYAGPDAGAAAIAFTRRGQVTVTDTALSVSELFALYESTATITAPTRLYVRGLNLSGRPVPPDPAVILADASS